MATWRDISKDSELAAIELVSMRRWRSAASRAYYAIYSRVTDRLHRQGVRTHGGGRGNPAHDALAALAAVNLRSLSTAHRRRLKRSIERLYSYRITADYFPGRGLDKPEALAAIGEMTVAMGILDSREGRR